MAFTPCCKAFQITIDPQDCLGVAHTVADLVWAQYLNNVDAFSSMTFTAAGGGGSFSCDGLAPAPFPQEAIAQIGLETNFCNQEANAVTLRFTHTYDYTLHTAPAQFNESHVQMSIGVDGAFNFAFQNVLFNAVFGAQNASGVGVSTFFDVVVAPCATTHLQLLFDGFASGTGSTYHLSGGTLSIVKL